MARHTRNRGSKMIRTRLGNGRFTRSTLANTFGLKAPICATCRSFSPHKVGEAPATTCHFCGDEFVDIAAAGPDHQTIEMLAKTWAYDETRVQISDAQLACLYEWTRKTMASMESWRLSDAIRSLAGQLGIQPRSADQLRWDACQEGEDR